MEGLDPARRRAFSVINFSSAPVWLAMILAPRARLTGWLVARTNVLHVGLGLAYDSLLVSGIARQRR